MFCFNDCYNIKPVFKGIINLCPVTNVWAGREHVPREKPHKEKEEKIQTANFVSQSYITDITTCLYTHTVVKHILNNSKKLD